MPSMIEVKCKRCKQPFMARVADRNRGWGRFCSKSCKAIKQERRTGQHADYKHRENFTQLVRDANGGKGPRDFQREFGGIPQFNNRGEYEGFTGGGFDNTAHQHHDENG